MEPAFDLSEIVGLYKEDARQMIATMFRALDRWPEVVTGGEARQELRKLAHQLRGSGRTYGFRDVTRTSKALEGIMIRMQKQSIMADDRTRAAIQRKIAKLETIFKE